VYRKRVVILGAGGRDFHNFLTVFRGSPDSEVVAFVFTQIPGVGFRRCPPSFAGEGYVAGIPVYPIEMLPNIVKTFGVDEVVLSLSDLTYEELGRLVSYILSLGCDFRILGPRNTMLDSVKPVVAITATKTGAGKSTISRAFVRELAGRGVSVAVVRHPMVYSDIGQNLVQVFRRLEDLDRYRLTIEEREEYEPHLELGATVLAGVDYAKILLEAEKLGDAILWDGGNNDWPFYRPWYWVAVTDATRAGIETGAYPGEVNIRLADAVIITKVGVARREDVDRVVHNVKSVNPGAIISKVDMDVRIDNPGAVSGKRVVVVEDAPTVTHGGSPYGAGYVAARKYGAEVVDPRSYAVGVFRDIYERYPHIGPVIPSLGYTDEQLKSLEQMLNRIEADAVLLATPARLERILRIDKPVVRVSWEAVVVEGATIRDLVDEFLSRRGPKQI